MSKPMLHVLHSLSPADGGPAEGQRQICASYAGAGASAEVVTLDPPTAPWIARWPVPVHALGGVGKYGFTPRLIGWLRENHARFSCAFVHGLWQWQGFGSWLALRSSELPYFMFPHGMLDPWFRTAWPVRHARKALYWGMVEHRVVRDAAGVIFTSEEERVLGKTTFAPWSAQRELVIPLGTVPPGDDPQALRERFFAQFPALRGQRLLLFLGRLHSKKGCDLLIEAFRRVNPPMHLVMAGPCHDDRFSERLQAQAAGLAVTFTGPLWDREKWGALAAAEVFALPSHQENFGIAVAEALASGVPVLISTKVNIWREVVEDGAGFAEEDTLEGTIRLLERWLSADQSPMRQAAIRTQRTRFDIRQTAAALARLAEESSS